MASIGSLYALLKLDSKGFNGGMKSANRSMSRFSKNVNRTAGKIAGLYGVFASGRALIRSINTYTEMSNRLKLVTTDAKNLADVQQELFDVAQKSRGAFSTTVDLYSRLSRSTQELGISQQRLIRISETVNKAITISGSSTQASNAALIQLGQGLAAGALRGQELNSVMEQTPRLSQALADGLGVSIGQLREMGKAGEITAAKVIQALESQSAAVDREFGLTEQTIAQSLQRIENIALKTFGSLDAKDLVKALNEFGETLEDPAIIDGLQSLAGAMLTVASTTTKGLASIKAFASGLGILTAQIINPDIEDQIRQIEARISKKQKILDSKQYGEAYKKGVRAAITDLIFERKRLLDITTDINEFVTRPPKPSDKGKAVTAAADVGPSKELIKSQDRARAKILAFTQALEQQAATFGKSDDEILRYKISTGELAKSFNILGLEGAGARGKVKALADVIKIKTDVDKAAKKAQEELNKNLALSKSIYEETRTPIERLQTETEKLNKLMELGAKRGGITFDTYSRAIFKAQDEFDALNETAKEGVNIAEELGLTFSSAFEDAIVEGGKLSDILKGLEKDILRIVTRNLVTKPLAEAVTGIIKPGGGGNIFSNIFGSIFGGGKALGGPVSAGTPYMVGEKGPEMFVPRSAGNIVPNNQMGGNININFAITTPTGNIPQESQSQIASQVARAVQRGRRNL